MPRTPHINSCNEMNAKDEFLDFTKDKEVKCAKITIEDWGKPDVIIILKVNYTEDDLRVFLSEIDINYDNGFGTQELFGNIWFNDNTWAERYEYDGSECWELKKLPIIPKELL